MKKTLTVMIDEALLERFEMALVLNSEEKDQVIDAQLRRYVSQIFAQTAAAYEQPSALRVDNAAENANYGKAIRKIPIWAKKTEQYNHRIIRAYFQLAAEGVVTTYALARRCGNAEQHPDVYVPTFASNFAQMKFDGEKSHGKVFEVGRDDVVRLWSEVEEVLMKYKDDFVLHTTDVGYLNRNNQRNLGKSGEEGTDFLQKLYSMRCENCGHTYSANGTDIFQKKCPHCQGGADTGK